MKKVIIFCMAAILLTGCAGTQAYRKDAQDKIQSYFNKPDQNILIVVDAIEPRLARNTVNCHQSLSFQSDPGANANSFNSPLPVVELFPIGSGIKDIQEQMKNVPAGKMADVRLSYMSSAPTVSITCQCQEADGIKGTIYYNGKAVSTDTANVNYGLISLSYTLPFEEIVSNK
jgi:hypothetical protein